MPYQNSGIDIKLWISLCAVFLSIVTFIIIVLNQNKQNIQWKALNEPNIFLSEVKMFEWREITDIELDSVTFPINLAIYPIEFKPGINRIVSCLFFTNPSTTEMIPGSNYVFTNEELDFEANRLGLIDPLPVMHILKPIFIFKNVGRTIAKNLQIKVEIYVNNTWTTAYETTDPITLPSEQNYTIYFDINIPPNITLGDMPHKINLSYQDYGGVDYSKTIYTTWNVLLGAWTLSETPENNK